MNTPALVKLGVGSLRLLPKKATKEDGFNALNSIADFMTLHQRRCIVDAMRGEEKQFFFDMAVSLAERIITMPTTYEQDGKGDQAIAYLHYFRGAGDWYITEKDREAEQLQAFGLCSLGYEPDLGYVSIVELLENNVELDLYFTADTLEHIKHLKGW